MVNEKGYKWEERTDGIMQILCTIYSKYGASLYTTLRPTTLNALGQYALHVLFVPLAPTSDNALNSTAAPTLNPFPFVHKLNTLDRDYMESLCQRVGTAGEISWYCTTAST